MRIGFIGSHSTGKTSVAEFITSDPLVGDDFVFVPSSARKVAAAGLGVNREATRESQLVTTLSRVVDEQKAFEENPDKHVLSDRTPLDSLAYTAYQMKVVWDHDPAVDFYYDYSRKFVAASMTKYDKLFYFPVGLFALTSDGLRENDADYRLSIDTQINTLLDIMDIDVYIVPDGTVQERARFVYKNLV